MASDEQAPALAPELALAQALARQMRNWALARGADAAAADLAAAAARTLSLAAAEGHVCQRLHDIAEPLDMPPQALRAGLLDSGVVGVLGVVGEAGAAGHSDTVPPHLPMVLDGDGRLYLHRSFAHERALALRLHRALVQDAAPDAVAVGAAGDDVPLTADEQQSAVARALRQHLTLISGGPGTGKTSLVVQLLARVLQADPGARIALAAPTGKAAARMSESIAERAAELPAEVSDEVKALLPRQAQTVHRLLGYRPDARPGESWRHDADNKLALDWLVVDEASMLDLALCRRLLDAVPDDARIVLLGDAQQLAAVEAGAVFAELASLAQPGPVVRLLHSHRFAAGGAIGRLASAINAGDAAGALNLLRGDVDPALAWRRDSQADHATDTDTDAAASGRRQGALPAATLQGIERAFASYVQTVRGASGADPAAAHAALQRARVLTATRSGPRGLQAVNLHLDAWARQQLDPAAPVASPWYHGRPVLVLRNQPVLRLNNGDVGIALRGSDGSLTVHVSGHERPITPGRLAEHQSGWAMTVHKAQGSEFDEVLLLLPDPPSPMLTRELLYTGVTRARQRVQLLASAAAVQSAIATPTQRASGLLARLMEAR